MQDDRVSRSTRNAEYISRSIRKPEYRNGFRDAIVLMSIFGVAGAALYFAHQWGTSRSMDALEPKPQVTVLVAPITPSPQK